VYVGVSVGVSVGVECKWSGCGCVYDGLVGETHTHTHTHTYTHTYTYTYTHTKCLTYGAVFAELTIGIKVAPQERLRHRARAGVLTIHTISL
jgi:hypothetical protein